MEVEKELDSLKSEQKVLLAREKTLEKTVGEFETGFEAELIKVRLEEQGVEAVVVGEDLVANMPTIERIKIELQVFEQYAEKAAKIIKAVKPMVLRKALMVTVCSLQVRCG